MIRASGSFVWAARRMLLTVLAIVFLSAVAMRSLSYLAFIALALIPTALAAYLERRGERAATSAIASMTIATLLPLVFGAINAESRDLLGSGAAWSFVCAAVLSGIAVYLLLPAATVWLDDRRAEKRLRTLRTAQEKLEAEWGPEVRAEQER